jgi:hypothetical protein
MPSEKDRIDWKAIKRQSEQAKNEAPAQDAERIEKMLESIERKERHMSMLEKYIFGGVDE